MNKHIVAEKDGVLHDLVDIALSGEDVVITRDGRAVAEIRGLEQPLKSPAPDMLDWVRARRIGKALPKESAEELVSRMRDEGER